MELPRLVRVIFERKQERDQEEKGGQTQLRVLIIMDLTTTIYPTMCL